MNDTTGKLHGKWNERPGVQQFLEVFVVHECNDIGEWIVAEDYYHKRARFMALMPYVGE